MTYDGVPGGFAFIVEGGMLPTIGPVDTPVAPPSGGTPESAGWTAVVAGVVIAGAAVDAGGADAGGLGSAQAAATAPTAITLNHLRVTSASLRPNAARSHNT